MPTPSPHAVQSAIPTRQSPGLVSGSRILWALVLTFVTLPFLDRLALGHLVEAMLLTAVLCSAVLAVGGRRRTLIFALSLAVPAVVGRWLQHTSPGLLPPELYLLASILTIGYVTWHFLRFVMNAPVVDSNVLCCGISAFLLLAMLWAFAYMLVERAVPGSFAFTTGPEAGRTMSGFIALYFSLVTLCTVGFGDIVPVSSEARMLAMFEGAAGVFFIAVLLSRLVSLYSREKGGAQAAPAEPTAPDRSAPASRGP